MLQKVELMGSKVIEISAASNIRLKAPGKIVSISIVELTGRNGKTHLYVDGLAYHLLIDNILHFLEIRKITTIVSHKARYARFFADTIDTGTILIRGSQRLLHIDRLASLHRHNGVGGMTGWRCGNINGIHFRIVNQFLSRCIPSRNMVTLSIATSLQFLSAHHRNDLRTLYFREGRTTFFLCHLTASDEAPMQ